MEREEIIDLAHEAVLDCYNHAKSAESSKDKQSWLKLFFYGCSVTSSLFKDAELSDIKKNTELVLDVVGKR